MRGGKAVGPPGGERVLCDTLGADAEWRPSFSRGEYHKVCPLPREEAF